jgi:hypothetical protein
MSGDVFRTDHFRTGQKEGIRKKKKKSANIVERRNIVRTVRDGSASMFIKEIGLQFSFWDVSLFDFGRSVKLAS